MVEIRAARPEDARAIARVHIAAWQSTYRGLMPDSVLDELSLETRSEAWSEILTQYGATHPVLVAEDAGVGICGFGNVGTLRDAVPGYTGEFKTLYLLASYQRRGIGRRMLGRLAALLIGRGHGSAVAWVLRANPSCGFCDAAGGVVCGQRNETLDDGEIDDVAYGWSDLPALVRWGER